MCVCGSPLEQIGFLKSGPSVSGDSLVLGNHSAIELDGSLSSLGTASGIIVKLSGASANISTTKVVYLTSGTDWAKTDADAESTSKGMLGYVIYDTDVEEGVVLYGFVRKASHGFTIGAQIGRAHV